MRGTMISCKAFVWTQENPTANLRESPRIAFSLRRRALLRLMRANRRFACRLKWALPAWASPTQNRTPSGKVHELKARETSQEPLALGQMLGKNRRAGFSLRKLLLRLQ